MKNPSFLLARMQIFYYNKQVFYCSNPLRDLRESIEPNRSHFARRFAVNYQTVTNAELGLSDRPARFVEILSALTGKPQRELLAEYQAWRRENSEIY